jgi:prephenate dehydrogenase
MGSEILIIGLNEIGASMALSLRESQAEVRVTGFDPDPNLAGAARKAGTVERVTRRLERAAQAADLVLLALSSAQVGPYLEVLAPELKEGAILLDLSPLKAEPASLAMGLFPEGRHYIGALPVVNPSRLDGPRLGPGVGRSDLFHDGLLALAVPPHTPEHVLDTAFSLAAILGADSFLIGAREADGVTAAVRSLPRLLGIALMRVTLESPGAREAQRMVGRAWAWATRPAAEESGEELAALLRMNKESVLPRIDRFQEELGRLRARIESGDQEELARFLKEAIGHYHQWLEPRRQGDWARHEQQRPSAPQEGLLGRLFGIGPMRGNREEG